MPGLIAPGSRIGFRQRRVKIMQPGEPVPDGSGGWVIEPVPANPPEMFAWIRPASLRDLENVAGGTVISQATHIVTIPYHPEITTQTQLMVEHTPHDDRTLNVVGVVNPDERDRDLELLCVEVIQ